MGRYNASVKPLHVMESTEPSAGIPRISRVIDIHPRLEVGSDMLKLAIGNTAVTLVFLFADREGMNHKTTRLLATVYGVTEQEADTTIEAVASNLAYLINNN